MTDFVVAVRLDDARDFVVDPSTLSIAPSVSKDFPNGCRVRVTDVAKCFPKSDTMAELLFLGKWTSGLKPHEGSVATVLASAQHPSDEECVVIGIRSELDGRDFVIDAKALVKAPNVSEDFPEGSNVRIKEAGKVFPKMDGAAKELTLSKWIAGTKPQDGEVGIVLGSTAHPADPDAEVIGVRTTKGQDFVVSPEGLEISPSESKSFPVGSRVYITNLNKLYTKMDEVARLMNLSRWAPGVKPAVPQTPIKPAEKTDDNAEEEEESAAKKRKLAKPLMSCAGEVKGSSKHPSGEGIVVGVRTETGQDFLVAEEGLELVPNQHKAFPFGTRVKVLDIGKVYPKFDEKAFQMGLTRWVLGEKPAKVLTGKVLGSVTK